MSDISKVYISPRHAIHAALGTGNPDSKYTAWKVFSLGVGIWAGAYYYQSYRATAAISARIKYWPTLMFTLKLAIYDAMDTAPPCKIYEKQGHQLDRWYLKPAVHALIVAFAACTTAYSEGKAIWAGLPWVIPLATWAHSYHILRRDYPLVTHKER